MVFISFVVLILAIAGVALGICSIGVAVVFGDAIIGITLLVTIIKKLFFNKKNKEK